MRGTPLQQYRVFLLIFMTVIFLSSLLKGTFSIFFILLLVTLIFERVAGFMQREQDKYDQSNREFLRETAMMFPHIK